MIVVVTGHPRSGTSMMMAALEAGGIPVAYSPKRDIRMQPRGQHQASGFNYHGVYELEMAEMRKRFPHEYDGMAVKVVWSWVDCLTQHKPGYWIIQMERDPEEVRQSYEATLSNGRTRIAEVYDHNLGHITGRLRNHPNTLHFHRVWYRDVIVAPEVIFSELYSHGLHIDPRKAASVVDPTLYRFRIENLVRGA